VCGTDSTVKMGGGSADCYSGVFEVLCLSRCGFNWIQLDVLDLLNCTKIGAFS
jgi:hypothetical protein